MRGRDYGWLLVSGIAACAVSGESHGPPARSMAEMARPAEAVAAPERVLAIADAPPKPEPAVVIAPPTKAPRSPYAFANDDPADDLVVAPPEPRADCHEALTAAGVTYADAKIPVHTEGKGRSQLTCGAEQIVVYRGSPARIALDPAPIVTCTMALAIARFEAIAQEEALRLLGERVVRVAQLGTYSCREMAAYRGWVSEHAYANAIDIESFVLKSGKRISVLQSFDRGEETRTRAGAFLRAVSRRAYDEEVFSNVLTPFFDKLHRNHFHLDMARYRNDGTRPLEDEP